MSLLAEEITGQSNREDDDFPSDYNSRSSDDGGGAPPPQPPKLLPKSREPQGPPALSPELTGPPVPTATRLTASIAPERRANPQNRTDERKPIAGQEKDRQENNEKEESRDCREKKKRSDRERQDQHEEEQERKRSTAEERDRGEKKFREGECRRPAAKQDINRRALQPNGFREDKTKKTKRKKGNKVKQC